MNLQATVILLLLAMLVTLVVWFRIHKKLLERQHHDHISVLENAISLNLGQITLRKEGLRRYDFLRYNLNESLVVQKEITLRT